MVFDGKPARDITVDDVRRLVSEHVAEDEHLDFKEKSYPSTESGTKELIKDVTAFANADGGYIVLGVREDDSGRASSFTNIEDADGVRRSMIDRCLSRIEPRLRSLEVHAFDVDGKTVLVVRVAESDQKPHCSRPDAEHHYFWKRYQDGNRLMNTAEIRESFAGDRVARELADIRREMLELRKERTMAREATMEINDQNLFDLRTPESFLRHVEKQFLEAIGGQPYYRLWATPVPVNEFNLHDQAQKLLPVLKHPPQLRAHGWDVTPVGEFRHTAIGLICDRMDFRHLRLLWNGHLEFWTPADDDYFHWGQETSADGQKRILFPYAIIETAVCFVRLVRSLHDAVGYSGHVRFGAALYGIKGQYLLSGDPESFGYRRERSWMDTPRGRQPFPDSRLIVSPLDARTDDLPDEVAWRIVSRIYHGFSHSDDEIPCFDERHHCTLGNGLVQR